MIPIKLQLISNKRTLVSILIKYTFIGSFAFLIALIFLFEGSQVLNGVLVAIVFLSGILLGLVKEHQEIGEIELFEDRITVNSILDDTPKTSFLLSKIENLELLIKSYRTKLIIGTALDFNKGSSGLGNYLKLKDQFGVHHSYEFFIESKSQMESLKDYKNLVWSKP